MVPVLAPLLLALLLPRPAASTGLQLRGQRSPRDTKQDSIKVIISEGWSSQGDSSDSSHAAKELDLSPGSPLVLTHKIKLVPSGPGSLSGSGTGSGSCGCEAEFAALRERVENLEREVSALRAKCGEPEGNCCTSRESKGAGCSIQPDQTGCVNECSDQGRCVGGRCVCFPGFTGPDCGRSDCPGNCSDRGRCADGRCVCDPGFTGPDCSEPGCPAGCGGRGRCVDGRCECDAGFSGPGCSDQSCPGDCSNRGRCVGGRCVCDPGFAGPDCSTKACPGGCSDRGRCVDGRCVCDDGFAGADCSEDGCPNGCGRRGTCLNGKCVCEAGFSGPDCASRDCPNGCSSRGRCVKGACVCRRGFTGPDCSRCQEGRTGPDCHSVLPSVSQLSPEDVSETSVTLVWTPPEVQYDSYHISFRSQKDGDQLIPVQVDGGLVSFTQTGLAAGQDYSVSVVGELDGRRGAETSTTFRTLISGPAHLHVVKTSSTSAVVQWEEPAAAVDRYLLTVTPGDGEGRSQQIAVPYGQSSAHIRQLEAGREYDLALVAERGESRSAAATTQVVPGVATAALTLQVTQAPGPDRDSNPRPGAPGRPEEADSVRDRVPLTPRAQTLISRALAANGTRLRVAGRPKVSGPKPSRSSPARGGPDGPELQLQGQRPGPRDQVSTHHTQTVDPTAIWKAQIQRVQIQPVQIHWVQIQLVQIQRALIQRVQVQWVQIQDRRGGAGLQGGPAAPPSGELDPLHKLLTETFQSLNVSTFSVHLSGTSNLSRDDGTARRQLIGGLSSSSSSPSSPSSSSSSSSPSSPSSPSSSSPSVPDNPDSSGGGNHGDSPTDRKQPSLSEKVPYFRRTLPRRRPHPNLGLFQNRTLQNTRVPHRFPPRLNPEVQTESRDESSSDPEVGKVNPPRDTKQRTAASTPSKPSTLSRIRQNVALTDGEPSPVLRPPPEGGYSRQPSLHVGPLQNRTRPLRHPLTGPADTETSSPVKPTGYRPSGSGPETEEKAGTVRGTLSGEPPSSRHPPRRAGLFHRTPQNRTNLTFPQRGLIRKPVPSTKLNVGLRPGPGDPPSQLERDPLSGNQAGQQNVPRQSEQDQTRDSVERDSPTAASIAEDNGRGANELEEENPEESKTTNFQESSHSHPGLSGSVPPPTGPAPLRTMKGERSTPADDRDSSIRSGTKESDQEDGERIGPTSSDPLNEGLAPEESPGTPAEGLPTTEEPGSKAFRPSTTRPDESEQGASTRTRTNILVQGGLTMKPIRPFSPPKREPAPTTGPEARYSRTGSHGATVRPSNTFSVMGANEGTITGDSVSPRKNTSGPASPVRPISRKPPTRTRPGHPGRTQIESQHSRIKPGTTVSDLVDNVGSESKGSEKTGTGPKGTPTVNHPDSRPPRPVPPLKRQPSTRVRTEENHARTGSQGTDRRPGTRGLPGTKATGPPTLQEPHSRPVRPVIPPKRFPPTRTRPEEQHTPIDPGRPGGRALEPSRPVPLSKRVGTGGSGSQSVRPGTGISETGSGVGTGGSDSQTVRPGTSESAVGDSEGPVSAGSVWTGQTNGSVIRDRPTLKLTDSRASRPGPVTSPKKTKTGLLHTPMRHRVNQDRDRPGSGHSTERLLGSGTAAGPEPIREPPEPVREPPEPMREDPEPVREPLDFVGVTNQTSDGFTLVWDSPEGKYQNFVVTGKVSGTDEEGEDSRDGAETGSEKTQPSKHNNRVPEGSITEESTVQTGSFQTVAPGSARSLQVQDLLPKTEYTLTLLGTGPGLLSRLHKLVISTGPEPPTNIVFSKVTEDSVTVSWTKPRSPVSGFKVTYSHPENGEPVSVSVDSEDSSVGLSRLSPGSSYEVNVVSTLGLDESDPLHGLLETRPDPPSDLRVVNVSSSSALLLWRPVLAAVDQYAIVYGAGTGSELRISVTGNAAQQWLSGLDGSTTYTVTVSSRRGDQDSRPASASFTTAGSGPGEGGAGSQDLRASDVTPRTATLSWKTPSQPVDRYRLTYQTAGQDEKVVFVDASVTQFNLSRLRPGSSYSAVLQAERGGGATSESSTHFTTGPLRFSFPSDCSQELLNGLVSSGEVEIFPGGEQEPPVTVYCDMETDGGGWTVFQRRKDGSEDFFRGWKDYVRGFGDVNGEFWLGLDSLTNLTSMTPMTLRVDLRDADDSAFAQYSTFAVGGRNYRLTVGGYGGTAGDSFSYHNGRIFSTRDRDPAPFITRCAMSYRGGWWYKNCHQANLNGLYGVGVRHQGVVWTSWRGNEFSIPFTEMKMRPTAFRPPSRG
ncbi:LOW QUALITY PROTEIN: mucin-4 [Salarias fasciatus]|uniref:LOW QUALITY PROTEIN: mucin-4 n=1 Tax=Salarias fasciatus TaxID=181472 RepID=UPI00117684F2|nr:LOW QUALITY PROTEIN: mucin-4-like [Salarias fasciatus]